jgi:hypothetical protein
MLFIVTGSLGGGIGISCKDFGNKLIIEVQEREKKMFNIRRHIL